MSAYTPGPWDTCVVGCIRRNTEVFAHDGTMVALVYGADDPDCVANALLIAAAPDLLEALKRAHLITCPTVDPIYHTCGGCSISALVAKAEGRS